MSELRDLLERRASQLDTDARFERVLERARRRHRNRRIGTAVVALAVFAAAGTGVWVGFHGGNVAHPRPRRVAGGSDSATTFEQGPAEPPVPFLADDHIIGPLGDHAPLAARPGGVSPMVQLFYPNGPAAIAYTTFRDGGDGRRTPLIRLYHLDTDTDEVFQEGAASFAAKSDGTMAYFQGTQPRTDPNQPYVGQVFVRYLESFGQTWKAPQQWTGQEGMYVVQAWAGDSLLVYRVNEGGVLDVLALNGPSGGPRGVHGPTLQERVLARGASIVAVSPDGSQVLLNGQADGSSIPDTLEVVDVSTGQVVASMHPSEGSDPETGQVIGPVGSGGQWSGDRVVAPSTHGIAVLRVADGEIRVERFIDLSELSPWGPYEPGFPTRQEVLSSPGASSYSAATVDDTSRVVAWMPSRDSGGIGEYLYVDCDIAARHCVHGPPAQFLSYYRIYDPSRPAPQLSVSGSA